MTTGTNTITPAKYITVSETKYESKNYKVLVGFVKDGELPQYVILNKETNVVEFNHEVLSFAREWVAHFQQRLDDLDAGKKTEDSLPQAAFN